jgi:hypothetical protein
VRATQLKSAILFKEKTEKVLRHNICVTWVARTPAGHDTQFVIPLFPDPL